MRDGEDRVADANGGAGASLGAWRVYTMQTAEDSGTWKSQLRKKEERLGGTRDPMSQQVVLEICLVVWGGENKAGQERRGFEGAVGSRA